MNRIDAARRAWERLALRERRLVAVGTAVLLLSLVWMLGIAPALKTLRSAPAQLQTLDTQLESMRRLAAQAKSLQSRPAVTRETALRTLESSLQQRFGASAQFNVVGERVTVTFKGAAPEALAQWLSQVRLNARALATQARLTRNAGGWDGSLVLDIAPSS